MLSTGKLVFRGQELARRLTQRSGRRWKKPMKVQRNTPLRATRAVAQAAYSRRVEGGPSLDTVAASASVLGIPEDEFTPRVRDAIMGLMSEVDSLRRDLNQARSRLEALLSQVAADHPRLAVAV